MKGDYSGEGEIVVLCPTRENPVGALDMVRSFYATVHRVETEVILAVDDDDETLPDYLAIPEQVRPNRVGMGITRPDPPRVIVLSGKRNTGSLTAATNAVVKRVWDTDCIIGHVGDDHRFRTPGWDTVIRKVLLDQPGVAYAYDGFRSAWASEWFTNAIIPRTLGWLAVPGSKHLTIDDVFMDIGAGLDRLQFLPDVLIEHLHPAGGKVPWRDIVKSHYAKPRRAQEEANLARYRAEHFADDIAKLRVALGLPAAEVTDFSPGVTFRKAMGGKWTLPTFSGTPPLEELEKFAGRTLVLNSPAYLKVRRLWLREHRHA